MVWYDVPAVPWLTPSESAKWIEKQRWTAGCAVTVTVAVGLGEDDADADAEAEWW
jgi:hypothetical protein